MDTKSIFPMSRHSLAEGDHELLPEDPHAIVELAVKMSAEQPVIFYGSSDLYTESPLWPEEPDMAYVAVSLRINAQLFFDSLLNATSGFYFVESDKDKDLHIMRGTNFRSKHPKGLCLFLASSFASKSDYLQAAGRVKRGADEGQVWVLQTNMYPE